MAEQLKEFKPLMVTIENVLKALEENKLPDPGAIKQLRSKYEEYKACCCMQAHVIKY